MNNDELIELYLGGKLPMDEAEAFEARLTNDLALQEEVRLYKLARTVIHLGIKERNKEKFVQWGAKLLEETKKNGEKTVPVISLSPDQPESKLPPPHLSKNIYRLAAAFLVLVAAFMAFWFFTKGPELTPKLLIAEHVATPMSEGEKSIDSSTQLELDNLSTQGILFFKKEKYDSAFQVYQKRYEILPQESDLLYQGVSLLKQERYQEAINMLKRGTDDVNLRDQFQWHLIVAYYSMDNRQEFEEAICQYAEKDYSYQKSLFLQLIEQEKISCE